MGEIFRSRDCIIFTKDDSFPVVVDNAMVQAGWPGGQGVQWVSSGDEFVVTFSRGQFGGFLVWGSDEEGDDFTAITRNQPHYRFATLFSGAVLLATRTFEVYTRASRLSPPLIPITYAVNEPLYLSLRGLWTTEDELTLSGDPDAPAPVVGYVAQVPKSLNNFYLGVQAAM